MVLLRERVARRGIDRALFALAVLRPQSILNVPQGGVPQVGQRGARLLKKGNLRAAFWGDWIIHRTRLPTRAIIT